MAATEAVAAPIVVVVKVAGDLRGGATGSAVEAVAILT